MDEKEKRAHKIYEQVLKIIENSIGNGTTYTSQLNNIGSRLFSISFLGVFASDEIPKMKHGQVAILNLDKRSEPGSHWVAIAKDGDESRGDTLVYDSFGRKSKKILSSVFHSGNGRVVDADYDQEQANEETNCGARAVAWLLVYKLWGREMALLI